MSRGGIEAGRTFVRMFLDDAEMSAKLQGVQAKLRATGAAMAIFIPFSDTMQEVQAVTQATAAEFDVLNEKAKELGRTTSFTASQVAGAMAELGRAGFDPQQIESATEHVLDLARATTTELPRAAEVMASTMNQFGLSASDSKQIADTLTATVNSSAQGMEDLAEALKPVAPIAAEAGASLEQTSAAIGILANNGIKGSLAGSALARAYKNLSTPATRKELERLGVTVVDANGNLRAMTDIMADVSGATENFGNADRLAVFESLFGRGQAAALKLAAASKSTAEKLQQLASPEARRELEKIGVTLADDAGKAKSLGEVFDEVKIKTAGMSNQERKVVFKAIGFDDLLSKIRLWEDAASETADTMDGGIGGSFRRMMSAIEGVAIALAEAVEGPATDWMEWVSSAAGRVSKFISENRALVVLLAKTGATLVVVGGAFVAVAGAIKVVTLTMSLYRSATMAATAAQAALLALSGPKGWALLAAGVAIAGASVYALNEALGEDAEAAKAAAAANAEATDGMADTQAALDKIQQGGPPDLTPAGIAELAEADLAVHRLVVTMASLRGETERAVRTAAAGDALKGLALLGGDTEANAADRVRKMLESAVPAGEKLKAKLLQVEAAFALLDRPVPEALRATVRLSIIDQATGAVSNIRKLQDEIAVLEGRATEASQKVRDMLAEGAPPAMVERYRQLAAIREQLAEQDKAREAESRERIRTEKQQQQTLRAKADQIKDQNTTGQERIELELSELEQLRAAIDPDSNTPLLDEETYRRELERLHARQIELSAQDAKRINGGAASQLANNDLRSQGGANILADLLNGRQDVTQQQLQQLVRFNENVVELIELTGDRDQIKKVTF